MFKIHTFSKHLQPQRFSNFLALTGLLIVFVAVPLTVIVLQKDEEVTTIPSCTKTGDINCDNSINSGDLAVILSKWGTTGTAADLNRSGKVDSGDLAILIANWGR